MSGPLTCMYIYINLMFYEGYYNLVFSLHRSFPCKHVFCYTLDGDSGSDAQYPRLFTYSLHSTSSLKDPGDYLKCGMQQILDVKGLSTHFTLDRLHLITRVASQMRRATRKGTCPYLPIIRAPDSPRAVVPSLLGRAFPSQSCLLLPRLRDV